MVKYWTDALLRERTEVTDRFVNELYSGLGIIVISVRPHGWFVHSTATCLWFGHGCLLMRTPRFAGSVHKFRGLEGKKALRLSP